MTQVRVRAIPAAYSRFRIELLGSGGVPADGRDPDEKAVVLRTVLGSGDAAAVLDSTGTRVVELEPTSELLPAGTAYRVTFLTRPAAVLVHTVPVGSVSVTNKMLTGNVATLTTGASHGWVVGYTVTVVGVGAPFDGTFTVTAVGATSISYAVVAANVAAVAASGTVTVGVVDAYDFETEPPGTLPSGPLAAETAARIAADAAEATARAAAIAALSGTYVPLPATAPTAIGQVLTVLTLSPLTTAWATGSTTTTSGGYAGAYAGGYA